jgi:hypothetical protein
MGNISRETEAPRNNSKGTLKIKDTAQEIKNAFNGLINKLYAAELENKSDTKKSYGIHSVYV